MKIAVFMGGTSAERDVSLASGAAVLESLKVRGHEVIPIDPARGFTPLTDNELEAISEIDEKPPENKELQQFSNEKILETILSPELKKVDVIFLILHGGIGEDGTIQAILDLVNVPYTGSGVLGSAMAMDKIITKKLFLADDIPTPEYFILESHQRSSLDSIDIKIKSRMGYPAIIKPINQGSSVGLTLVNDRKNLHKAIDYGFQYGSKLLVEKYIAGRELTVAILGEEALPTVEILPESGMYDYEHKYTDGRTEYICPTKLDNEIQRQINTLGIKAFKALNCSGFGRVDFRLAEDNELFCLEANTLPGMTSHSLVPKAAMANGMNFAQLLEKICLIAVEDFKRRKSTTGQNNR
ncbi:MAG: D-alanine--D-alanine ligase [candidate division Zixibacteria bacterium]|nr:D-alanine--D-alanine ligase [candidate division Zixibacteria bacterium]